MCTATQHRIASYRRLLRTLITTAISIVAYGGIVPEADASHFRYGHYFWQQQVGSVNTIEFEIRNVFRRDGYSCINPTNRRLVPCTGPNGLPGRDDFILEFIGQTRFNPGDGTAPIGSPGGPLMYRVVSFDATNDWLEGVALDPAALPNIKETITHRYATSGRFVAFTDSCCRISPVDPPNGHLNNPDGGYRVETIVNVGSGNRPPRSGFAPIASCVTSATNAVCSFILQASDPDGDRVRCRLSTSTESSAFGQFVQPRGATVDPQSCRYVWDTTGVARARPGLNTLYSTQVTIEDLDSAGNVKSKTAVDFFIELDEVVPPLPNFNRPPTPICNTTITGRVGAPLSFTVEAASAAATRTMTLNVVGLSTGARMTPPLPLTGAPGAAVRSTFSWTPASTQAGTTVVTFLGTDSLNQQVLCSYTLRIEPANGECTQQVINGRVSFVVSNQSLNPTPVARGPAGTLLIQADLTNTSSGPIKGPINAIVTTLTGGNFLLSASEGNGAAGSKQRIADSLLPGGTVRTSFSVGLATRQLFQFFVDVEGCVR
jgi:hypothetical protein